MSLEQSLAIAERDERVVGDERREVTQLEEHEHAEDGGEREQHKRGWPARRLRNSRSRSKRTGAGAGRRGGGAPVRRHVCLSLCGIPAQFIKRARWRCQSAPRSIDSMCALPFLLLPCPRG